jgi:hypothetical protein
MQQKVMVCKPEGLYIYPKGCEHEVEKGTLIVPARYIPLPDHLSLQCDNKMAWVIEKDNNKTDDIVSSENFVYFYPVLQSQGIWAFFIPNAVDSVQQMADGFVNWLKYFDTELRVSDKPEPWPPLNLNSVVKTQFFQSETATKEIDKLLLPLMQITQIFQQGSLRNNHGPASFHGNDAVRANFYSVAPHRVPAARPGANVSQDLKVEQTLHVDSRAYNHPKLDQGDETLLATLIALAPLPGWTERHDKGFIFPGASSQAPVPERNAQHDKGFILPAPSPQSPHDIIVPISQKGLMMVTFRSDGKDGTLHGTKEWNIALEINAAKKIQKFWRQYRMKNPKESFSNKRNLSLFGLIHFLSVFPVRKLLQQENTREQIFKIIFSMINEFEEKCFANLVQTNVCKKLSGSALMVFRAQTGLKLLEELQESERYYSGMFLLKQCMAFFEKRHREALVFRFPARLSCVAMLDFYKSRSDYQNLGVPTKFDKQRVLGDINAHLKKLFSQSKVVEKQEIRSVKHPFQNDLSFFPSGESENFNNTVSQHGLIHASFLKIERDSPLASVTLTQLFQKAEPSELLNFNFSSS